MLMSGGEPPPPAPAPPPVAQLDTVDVLVAKNEIGIGHSLSGGDLGWQQWPSVSAGSFIRRTDKPDAIEQFAGAVARAPIGAGEPVRENRLIKAKGSGYMAAILPPGMRAISTEISVETGAGGFILPNDRVDVLLTKREKNPDKAGPDISSAEVILSNVRVLAIDQAPKEKEGSNALVGKTVTLELKPDQAETLARSRQGGSLTLALRSIADANAVEKPDDQPNKRGENLNVIRYGVASQQMMQK